MSVDEVVRISDVATRNGINIIMFMSTLDDR